MGSAVESTCCAAAFGISSRGSNATKPVTRRTRLIPLDYEHPAPATSRAWQRIEARPSVGAPSCQAYRCGETARAVSPATTSISIVDYCSRVAVLVPQTCASTLPAGSIMSAVWEPVNAVPAALSRIVADTLSNVPSGVPSGAPNGV